MFPTTITIPSFVSPDAFLTVYQSAYSDIIKLSMLYQKWLDIFTRSAKYTDNEQIQKQQKFEQARQETRTDFTTKITS